MVVDRRDVDTREEEGPCRAIKFWERTHSAVGGLFFSYGVTVPAVPLFGYSHFIFIHEGSKKCEILNKSPKRTWYDVVPVSAQ
jgi:hypothetical protein